MQIIERKCTKHNVEFKEEDKIHFFGIFDTATDQFRFVGGDVDLIKGAVHFVNEKISEFGEHYFARKRRQTTFHDVQQLSIGTFFARKEKTLEIIVAQSGSRSMNEEEISNDLFSKKIEKLFSSAQSKLKLIHPITKDVIKIVKIDGRIRADAACVFCENKRISVQCNAPANSNVYYWNISNLGKHIDIHKKEAERNIEGKTNDESYYEAEDSALEVLRQIKVRNDADEIDSLGAKIAKRRRKNKKPSHKQPNLEPIKKQEKPTTNDKKSDQSSTTNQNEMLTQQALSQNMKNLTNTLQNWEKTENMIFMLNGCKHNIKVIEINPDGSCLFSTIAHQMYDFKANSEENKNKAADLRNNVVVYINANFEQFKHDLKGRVYEMNREKAFVEEIDKECRTFLNDILPLESCYAGYESVKAISEIEELNIITISEDGDCYMAVEFNEKYKRTVFLAHRLSENGMASGSGLTHNCNRNHYDSVSEISNEVLDLMTEFLNEKRYQKANQLNNNSILSISDTTIE